MRPTSQLSAGMPGGKTWSGWWGNMGGPAQKGVYTYSVSPFAQKPFKGALQGYLFFGFKRIAQQVPYWALPVGFGYAVYTWGNNKYAYYNSKEGHHKLAMEEGGH